MNEPLPTQAEADSRVRDAVEVFWERGNRWRFIALLASVVAVISLCVLGYFVALGVQWHNERNGTFNELTQQGRDTKASLAILQEETSPEKQAASAAALAGILIKVDCNNRASLQQVVDQFLVQGLLTKKVTVSCT